MRLFASKAPWYSAGLAFECAECGVCCAGPAEGYVWITDSDIAAIAEHLAITEKEMRRKYVRRVFDRLSLIENRSNNDCIFLRPRGNGDRGCAIYAVRPVQCRTWPFWPGNIEDPDAWAFAQIKCRGINRGKLHTCDEIDARRNATRE